MSDPLKRELTDESVAVVLAMQNELLTLDREIPGQVVQMFLYIASHNPCHKQALEEDLGFSTASASRNSDWLSIHHRLKKKGLGLIHKYPDPSNRRRQMFMLTPKGDELIHRIKEHINALARGR